MYPSKCSVTFCSSDGENPWARALQQGYFPKSPTNLWHWRKLLFFFKISPRSCTVAVPLKGPLETPTDRKKNKPQFPVLLLKILGFTLYQTWKWKSHKDVFNRKIAKLNGGFSGLPTLTPSTVNSSWWLLLLSLDSIAGKKHRYQGNCACHMFSHRTMRGSILSKEV